MLDTSDDFREAQRRIAAARASGATVLDLGDLALEHLPDELGSLQALRVLALGESKPIIGQDGGVSWHWVHDRVPNTLIDIAPLSSLSTLQSLNLAGCESLSDIGPLSSLTSLQSLDLGWCKSLSDIAPLSSLTALQSLNLCGCASLSDIAPLSSLTALKSLNLARCESLSDIAPLSSLTALQSLNLASSGSLSDIAPLSSLTALQSLSLASSGSLSDIAPLSSLTALQSLNLEGCESLSDITPLSSLAALQSLNLERCGSLRGIAPLSSLTALQSLNLRWCASPSDITPLSSLTALRSLDLGWCKSLIDIAPLSSLAALQSLNLALCASLSDIAPLSSLTALQSLNLERCGSLRDITPLSSLSTLRWLYLSRCQSLRDVSPLRALLGGIDKLILHGCRFDDLPSEICGGNRYENVIHKVRAHYADLDADAAPGNDLKVFVLGNGGVGKTQLCRRLQGLPFDASVASTHGIALGELDLILDAEAVADDGERQGGVHLRLWDFGGQDIYHGSHTLFVQGRAVFIVLWTPELEAGSSTQGGACVRNRPLAYWLDYLRNLVGSDVSVLVVQGHCDRSAMRQPAPAETTDFRYCRLLHVSPKTGLGLEVLRGELGDAVREELERRPLPRIGRGRVEVREQLRQWQAQDRALPPAQRRHRSLSVAEFAALCADNGKVHDAAALLDYLHQCGELYYQPGLFEGCIILDQSWALQAIYTLFDRERVLPILNRHGRFTRRELALLAWSAYSEDEQELFLSFMHSCGICFPVKKLPREDGPAEWEYLAPELLPEWSEVQGWLAGRMCGAGEVSARVEYRFLHEGVLRNLLAQVGAQALDNAIYWKYGCWFYEAKSDSQVLVQSRVDADSGAGAITLRAIGRAPRTLMLTLLRLLAGLRVGQAAQWECSWRAGVLTLDAHTLDDAAQEPEHADPPGAPTLDDRRDMRQGDWISEYMKAIAQGDHVLVIISQKYLQSTYCMTELHAVYQRALGDKGTFLERIVPVVLDDAGCISRPSGRVDCAEYWEREGAALGRRPELLSVSDFRLWQLVRQWQVETGNMLAFIADTLHPHGFDAIVRDDYAGVRERLERRSGRS